MYKNIIMLATGCTTEEAEDVEDIMRNDIFHSTLDWQTKEQLEEAARVALHLLREEQESIYPSLEVEHE